MIFADKLITLRKKSGWSQEELAEQMNVTRQSVSKWEGAQSIPDLEKMLRISELFGVSLDYLLKDEIEETERIPADQEDTTRRHVSMEEANAFLAAKMSTAKPVAYAVYLCVLSPVCLLMLGALSESPAYRLSENMACGIGLIVLLLFVIAAVAIFISCGNKTSPYEYLENEIFETEYGVTGMVRERRERFRDSYVRSCIIGTCICIASAIPLFAGMVINAENDLFMVAMLCLTLALAGCGAMILTRSGIPWASYEKLLQEGDYTRKNKEHSAITNIVSGAYWCIATAVFLAISLPTNNWGRTWVVWPVAGVLFPAVLAVTRAIAEKRRDR